MRNKFIPGQMPVRYGHAATYRTQEKPAVFLPTLRFFAATAAGPLLWLWRMAKAGKLDDYAWAYSSGWLADIFESMGCKIEIQGMDAIKDTTGPCVIIANHMSTLETFLLPGIIRPFKPVTFVVKKSLVTMPVFGPIMRTRDPVVVERKNPREDLAIVLEEGVKRLKNGISVVVFPQHTRSLNFDASQFNSIGIKLARKANAPILPLALKTDAWGQGKKIKELGRIRPDLPARFLFTSSMPISGTGKQEHAQVCEFIEKTVKNWQTQDGVNK